MVWFRLLSDLFFIVFAEEGLQSLMLISGFDEEIQKP